MNSLLMIYLTVAVVCLIMAVATTVFLEKKGVTVGNFIGMLVVSLIPVLNGLVVFGMIVNFFIVKHDVVLFRSKNS